MCYTVEYIERKGQAYAERYDHFLDPDIVKKSSQLELPLYYLVNGFSHPKLPIVTQSSIELCEWGLIPSWAKDLKFAKEIQNKTLNAVGSTVFEKPSYKYSILHKRGILGLNGFYEWREIQKKKYPYFIFVKSQRIFSVACIYEEWTDKDTGELFKTFSMLTTEANPLMAKIHNLKKRMPLILNHKDEAKWVQPDLDIEDIKSLIKPYDDGDMQAYTISKDAGNTRLDRNVPEILDPVEYPELQELL